ncbi:MAG TPA: type II secretion system protein [Gemmatimonadaceae bacterium]|nr:type II secretion system protein [Gemmatimonadaceae bacterium]
MRHGAPWTRAIRGTTLVEIGVILAVIGIAAGMALPRFTSYRDWIAADAAAASTMAALSTARHAAIRRATVTAVRFDTAGAWITVHSGPDTILRRALGVVHGVRLAASRDSIAYAPNGMGFGAANTRLILSRGAAAETLAVSRLGRARR